jgi:hypothetical protein
MFHELPSENQLTVSERSNTRNVKFHITSPRAEFPCDTHYLQCRASLAFVKLNEIDFPIFLRPGVKGGGWRGRHFPEEVNLGFSGPRPLNPWVDIQNPGMAPGKCLLLPPYTKKMSLKCGTEMQITYFFPYSLPCKAEPTNWKQGVCQLHCRLAIYIKKYLKAKEDLWKTQIFPHAKL